MQIVDMQLLEIRDKFRDFYNQNLIDDYKELEKNMKTLEKIRYCEK